MASFFARLIVFVLGALAFLAQFTTGQASFTPVLPPSYPLAVRNPYLSGKASIYILQYTR